MYNVMRDESHDKRFKTSLNPQQNFGLTLIQNVSCISTIELQYIFYKLYGWNKKVVSYMVRQFEAWGYCHFDKDEKFICAGKSYNDSRYTLDLDTIYAIAVANCYAVDPCDYKTMYIPSNGSSLAFLASGESYNVVVMHGDSMTDIYFYEEKYKDLARKMEKTHLFTEDEIKETSPILLITYPPQAYSMKKKLVKKIKAMELTVPYEVCFLTGDDKFGILNIETFTEEKEQSAEEE